MIFIGPEPREIDWIFNEWLHQNGTGVYPCLAHAAGFPNGPSNLTAQDLMATIGEHVPQYEHIRSHFADSTAIRTQMKTLADRYVLQNPTPKPAEECYPPKPDDEYNLSEDQKREIKRARYENTNIPYSIP